MFAIIYLIVLFVLGDSICRRFFSYASIPHRIASAFICGLLVSTWWTYFACLIFTETASPLLWGNLLFFLSAIGVIYWLNRRPKEELPPAGYDNDTTGFEKWDWIFLGAFFVFACWLMFGTFSMGEGAMLIANHQASDFGSTVAIMQSFAKGHNFPTEYPHYPLDRIRYHFLFYFQAGNLEYLGFSPSFSNNILSVLSVLSLLVLVMTLGVVTFASKVVGRIGAALFFFHGALSFIPYLLSKGSSSEAIAAVWNMKVFLPSGFDFRGETWGVWSQVVFANQRHFASSIAVFILVLTFLMMKYRAAQTERTANSAEEPGSKEFANPGFDHSDDQTGTTGAVAGKPDAPSDIVESRFSREVTLYPLTDRASGVEQTPMADGLLPKDALHGDAETPKLGSSFSSPVETVPQKPWFEGFFTGVRPFVFSGILLGLMPLWNGAVFMAAFAVLGFLFLLFPLRRQMISLALSTAVVAIPQIIYLKTGNVREAEYSFFHFGFTIEKPDIYIVLYYLAFILGVKSLLIAIALVIGKTGKTFRLRLLVAMSSLIFIMFLFRFSDELLANHKFLNIWLVVANLYVAAGLWYFWNLRILQNAVIGKVVACILVLLIVTGGVIDLFPIHNSTWNRISYYEDRLVDWVLNETDPKAIFLTHRLTDHRILLAGRKIYYGHPYYAWTIGYPTNERDIIYKKMYESFDPAEVLKLLHENRISYVIFDEPVRRSDIVKNVNEKLYAAYFPVVFTDPDRKYENLTIYSVPEVLGEKKPEIELPSKVPIDGLTVNRSGAFEGGEGTKGGEFSKPRGIAADTKGNFYVADTGNHRIQKFDADGKFVFAFAVAGELEQPNGIAVDAEGNIFVVDSLKHKLVKFSAEGKYVKEWAGPALVFYGPRDVAIGANKLLYILDQGRNRVVRFNPETEEFFSWGSGGSGDGQFNEATGIAVGSGFVFVTDGGNNRIQVFDLDGQFLRQWEVPVWNRNPGNYPDAVYDGDLKRLYVTSTKTNEILTFDVNGAPIEGALIGNGTLPNGPSSLTILSTKKDKKLLVLNYDGANVANFQMEMKQTK